MLILVGLVIGFLSFSQTEAQYKLDTPANQKLFVKAYADKLEKRLKGKSVGYAFVVRYKMGYSEGRAGGDARRAPDSNLRKMTVDDKFNIASVNKAITATAVMKLLYEKKIDLDTSMYKYLPPDWVMGKDVKTITLRELLTHRSGIRCDAVFFDDIKQCIADGIKLDDKKPCDQVTADFFATCYRNTNFVLFRFIIPRLFVENFTTDDNPPLFYAKIYNSYVNRHIFLPIFGVDDFIDTKPTDAFPALAYQFPTPVTAGTDFGDFTLNNAAGGFNMSAKQLSMFLSNLMFTERIVPGSVREQMKKERLGLYPVTHTSNLSEWGHAGLLPGKGKDKDGKIFIWNQGEINTMIVAYSNGVTLSLIINSQFGPNQGAWGNARDAMLEMSQ